jgi:hypothetical protein
MSLNLENTFAVMTLTPDGEESICQISFLVNASYACSMETRQRVSDEA